MAQSLENIDKAYKLLKDYSGDNPYIIKLKNSVFVYNSKSLNDIEVEYILANYDREPMLLNKIVKVAD